MVNINNLLTALKKCISDEDCDGCPYDGVCSERSFAVENDMIEVLEELVTEEDDGR